MDSLTPWTLRCTRAYAHVPYAARLVWKDTCSFKGVVLLFQRRDGVIKALSYLTLATVVAGIVLNVDDIRRYIRISTM